MAIPLISDLDETSFRYFVSLLLGYPVSQMYRQFFASAPTKVRHLFFILTGLGLCYYNFGNSTIHTALNILLTFTILRLFGGTTLSAILSFILNLGYLSGLYYVYSTEDYNIDITIPHSMLFLRLTGATFDVYDGAKKQETLSEDQRQTALKKVPSLFEFLGYCFFFGSILGGPYFSMKHYQEFISTGFTNKITGKGQGRIGASLERLVIGMFYMIAFQISSVFISSEYLLSKDYQDFSFLVQLLYLGIWAKWIIAKYIGVWLILEGSCILLGVGFNGTTKEGEDRWDACRLVRVIAKETSVTAKDGILSFNITTNQWMSKYVFKRLKWLGSKALSFLATMLVLSLWHGLYVGYLCCFLYEFLVSHVETAFVAYILRSEKLNSFMQQAKPILLPLGILKYYVNLGYGLIGFTLLTFNKTFQVFSTLYFSLHIVHIVGLLLSYFLPKRRPAAENEVEINANRIKKDG